jgi:hypothetical protein
MLPPWKDPIFSVAVAFVVVIDVVIDVGLEGDMTDSLIRVVLWKRLDHTNNKTRKNNDHDTEGTTCRWLFLLLLQL